MSGPRRIPRLASLARGACACGFALCTIPSLAQVETRLSLETWGYASWQDPASDSVLNPDNRIARLSSRQVVADTRLDLSIHAEAGDMVLRPRLLEQVNRNAQDTEHTGEFYLSQGFARMNVGHGLTSTVGRELLTWGPANFRSPSNPFYFDAGRTQPLREVPGIDLARVHYTDGTVSATGGYVFGGHRQTGVPDPAHTALLKVDYRGADYHVSAIASQQRRKTPFLGAFAQMTPHDALLLYGEIGSGRRASALHPSITSWTAPFQLRQSSPRRTTFLLGASYTLLNGQVLSLEYLHDGHGYSPAEERRYFRRASEVARRFSDASSDASASRDAAMLGLALSRAPALLGRDYVSIQWQSNPQEGSLYWRALLTGNVHDRSSQATFYVEKNISRRVSVFAVATLNTGAGDSEFGALLRSIGTLGIKLFVF